MGFRLRVIIVFVYLVFFSIGLFVNDIYLIVYFMALTLLLIFVDIGLLVDLKREEIRRKR